MKPASFEYYRAGSTGEALSLLHDIDGYAVALAGGQTLMPLLNLRLVQPDRVVDISRIATIARAREESAAVVLGAGCSHAALEDACFPDPSNGLLSRVASGIAYRSIRNRGTLGGSLAYADPAAEWPAVMMALAAELEIEGSDGGSTVAIEDFITGAMSTCLAAGELLVAVRIPKLHRRARWGFRKLSRKPGDFAQALAVVIAADETRVVIGATPAGALTLPRVAESIGGLETLGVNHDKDIEAAFSEDLASLELELGAFEEQIYRHTLVGAIKDAFEP